MGYALLFGLTTALVLGWVYWSASGQIQAQIDTGLSAETDALQSLYKARGRGVLERTISARSRAAAQIVSDNDPDDPGRRYYRLEAPDGRLLGGDYPGWPAAGVPENDRPVTITDRAGARVRAVLVRLDDGSHLLVGQALEEADELRRHIFQSLLAALAVTLLLGIAGGAWMGSNVQRRIGGIERTAGEIMAGDLTRRVPEGHRNDEFAELARRLNAMLDRIEALMRGMREVTDNVAHDLRHPLNRLRSRLEVTLLDTRDPNDYRQAMEEAISDADDLLQTFNALLRLAQLEAGSHRGEFSEVDASELVTDIAELYQPLAEDAGLTFTTDIQPGLRLRGDRGLLGQACANLLDNAIKYVPEGGRIEVSLRKAGDEMRLQVADSGPGIPAGERERVRERFVRLDSSRHRAGNGLGLSLVEATARLHGGRLDLADNRPGLKVAIRLFDA
jgi:signal transduction histidine kinase